MQATRVMPLFLALVPFLASCGEDVKASDVLDSGKEALGKLESIDVSKLGADEMKQKAGELVAMLETKFHQIKDEASALDVRKSAEPLVATLSSIKTSLGDKMPSLDQLKGALDGLETKFKGNEAVMKVLQPLLDKARQLLR